jgi:7-cyano-7-deazaguanine synthase
MVKRLEGVILISGGIDSTTLLYDLNRDYDLYALAFNYGSKHNDIEIRNATYQCNKLKVPLKVVSLDLNGLGFESSLLKRGGKIPEGHYSDDSMRSSVVPFRNGIMLSIAIGYAESKKISKVFYGNHLGDASQYPDCTLNFVKKMSNAGFAGTYNKVRVVSPYVDLYKKDIVKIGLELGVDYTHTHSCYNGMRPPCGKCGTCVERTESFYLNKEVDPLYPNGKLWAKAVEYMKKVSEK